MVQPQWMSDNDLMKTPLRKPFQRLACLAVILFGGCTTPSEADLSRNKASFDQPGRTLYLQYCSACHGNQGRGDGPAARGFCLPPPDLSTIASKRNGVFPFGEVLDIIQGNRQVDAHGLRKMPVWGYQFEQDGLDAGVDDPASIRDGNLVALAAYLESIQAPAPGEAP